MLSVHIRSNLPKTYVFMEKLENIHWFWLHKKIRTLKKKKKVLARTLKKEIFLENVAGYKYLNSAS